MSMPMFDVPSPPFTPPFTLCSPSPPFTGAWDGPPGGGAVMAEKKAYDFKSVEDAASAIGNNAGNLSKSTAKLVEELMAASNLDAAQAKLAVRQAKAAKISELTDKSYQNVMARSAPNTGPHSQGGENIDEMLKKAMKDNQEADNENKRSKLYDPLAKKFDDSVTTQTTELGNKLDAILLRLPPADSANTATNIARNSSEGTSPYQTSPS